jgi:formylglycine-generating enzyme required for sulfatase activity
LEDLAKDERKPLKTAFCCAVEEGAYKALKGAPDAAERASRKASIAQRVWDEHGLGVVFSNEALDILEAALFGEPKPPPAASPQSPPQSPPPQQPPPQSPPPPSPQPPVPAGFVLIPGGSFMMGSPENEPERDDDETRHQVMLSPFYIGKYEVTQKEFWEVLRINPSNLRGDNLPVENVNWYRAVEYCNRRSEREGLTPAYTINGTDVRWNRNANGYRLPTEAEWECACRAGTTTPFNTGNNITTARANYKRVNKLAKMVNVGSFASNSWGLYDMHGNVWEWCWDWYGKYPSGAANPAGPAAGASRVIRGGSWDGRVRELRSAYRADHVPSGRSADVGFRLARNAK